MQYAEVVLFALAAPRVCTVLSISTDVASVATRPQLRAAYSRLRDSLDAQAVVWVEGRLLPQEVALAPEAGATGVELLH